MNIKIPYEPNRQKISSDALSDFYAVLEQIINFYQESLMLYSVSRDSIMPKEIPARSGEAYGYLKYSIPKIQITERDEFHSEIYPVRLFQNTIVNIASCYEIYLRELAKEIYRYNQELLKIDEKQLTTKEILSYESLAELCDELIEKSVTNLIMLTYPDIVKKFESKFHIGIHSKKSPMTIFEVHHFLEVRNIIVHNEGHASKLFFQRLNSYDEKSPLEIKGELNSPKTDFEYIASFKDKLILLAEHIDNEARSKWKTTEYTNK